MFHFAHALQKDIEVVVRIGQAPLNFLPARLEHENAGRFLKNGPPILRLGIHDLFDLSLPDDGITFFAQADGMQTIDDVFHAAGLFVDQVFALPAAEQATSHRHFRIIEVRKHVRRIVERESDLTKRLALALLRSAENNVLHVRSAHGLGRLLAEHPADRVRHVAFSAAIRADDARHAVIEFDLRFICKRLKAVEFHLFKIQCSPPAPAFRRRNNSFAACFCASRTLPPRPSAEKPPAVARTVKEGACTSPSREIKI